MYSVKFFFGVLLLIFSTQSFALFMPAAEQINTDEAIIFNDVGC